MIARLFSRANLTQASTLKAIIGAFVSAGLIHISPEAQDQVVTWIGLIVGGAQALYALINFLHDDMNSIVTVSPVVMTASSKEASR